VSEQKCNRTGEAMINKQQLEQDSIPPFFRGGRHKIRKPKKRKKQKVLQHQSHSDRQSTKGRSLLPGTIFAAFAAALIVYVVLLHVEKNALSAYEKASVMTIAQDIEKGTVITADNVNQYFIQKELDKTLIPKAAVTDIEQLVGQYVTNRLDQGAILTVSMTKPMTEVISDIRKPVIAAFRTDDLYQVTNGILRSGDRIHIYKVETIEDEDSKVNRGVLMWENVLIWQVFDNAGAMIAPDDEISAAARANIILGQEDLERFYGEISTGALRVAKVWE
jgi:hypothetical protein